MTSRGPTKKSGPTKKTENRLFRFEFSVFNLKYNRSCKSGIKSSVFVGIRFMPSLMKAYAFRYAACHVLLPSIEFGVMGKPPLRMC